MKKILLAFLIISPAFALNLETSLTQNTFEKGMKIGVNVNIETSTPGNVQINYAILKDGKKVVKENETKLVNQSLNYKKYVTPPARPGSYELEVKAGYENETNTTKQSFSINADCVLFEELTNAYALRNQTQTLRITLKNTCEFNLTNVNVTLLDASETVRSIENEYEIILKNVTSPKTSQNVRISAVYDEGRSKGLIDYRIKNEEEMNQLASSLVESAGVMLNKSLRGKNLVLIGNRLGLEELHAKGVELFEKGLSELEEKEYSMAFKYLTESTQYFRQGTEESGRLISLQVIVIVSFSIVILALIVFIVYNKYKNAVEEKESLELGKS